MTEVKLKVNAEKLVNNLRYAFTDKTTYLAELMQNARRAGATRVEFKYDEKLDRLNVIDDGCGIQDLQNLLTVAESGWDGEIVEKETPYGLGFLSALFAAKHITVRSCGKVVSFFREDALAFKELAVFESNIAGGTEVILRGAGMLDRISLEVVLAQYAKGFPIPVILNGEELERPHKPNGGLWFENVEGSLVCFDGIDATPNSYGTTLGASGGLHIYLQGIQVCSLLSPAWPGGVIHLNPKVFFGRMPDRSRVLNQDEMLGWVRRVFNERWVARIHELKRTLDPEDFAARMYYTLKYWDCLNLLNDVPFIPPQVLGVPDLYPTLCTHYESNHHFVKRPVSRKDLEAGVRIVEADLHPYMEESFHAPMYVMAHQLVAEDEEEGELVYLLLERLPEGHWVNEFLVQVGDDNVTLELGGKIELDSYSGCSLSTNFALCDKVVLNGPLGEVEVNRPFFFVGRDVGSNLPEGSIDDGTIIMPSECADHHLLVRQLSDFAADHGFDDQAFEMEQSQFDLFLLVRTQKGNPEALKHLLQKAMVYSFAHFRGKSFRVTFSPDAARYHKDGITVEPIN